MGNCCFNSDNIPDNINCKDIPKYIPQINKGRVIKVYDGDTVTIVGRIKNNPQLFKFSVRLNNIDCPEIKPKKNATDDTETLIANKAKDYVTNKILNKIIILENVNLDKYGRLLADVYYDGELINECLINKKLAVNYNGGTKKCPKNWQNYYNGKETI